jgi:hypothetical protein
MELAQQQRKKADEDHGVHHARPPFAPDHATLRNRSSGASQRSSGYSEITMLSFRQASAAKPANASSNSALDPARVRRSGAAQ